MAKVALVAPAATVTEAGTAAALALLVSETSAPPTGAAMASVTVPVLPAPPVTVDGLSTRDARIGFTRMVAALEAPLELAVIVTTVPVVTRLVVMAKVALVAPAATVTETGTAAALALLLVSETTAPPAGAAALSVTVPVLRAPPVTVDGFITAELSVGAGSPVSAVLKRASAKSLYPVKLAPPAATIFPSSCMAIEDTASLATPKILVTLPPVPKVVSSTPLLL